MIRKEKLAEMALPLAAISGASAPARSIRYGRLGYLVSLVGSPVRVWRRATVFSDAAEVQPADACAQ